MFNKGYLIEIKSCMLDGHSFETNTLDGESYEMVIFINHFLSHFTVKPRQQTVIIPNKPNDFQFGNYYLSSDEHQLLDTLRYKSYEHFWTFMEYMMSRYPVEFTELFIHRDYETVNDFNKLSLYEKCDSLHLIIEDRLLGVSGNRLDNHFFRGCWRISNYYIPDNIEQINVRRF